MVEKRSHWQAAALVVVLLVAVPSAYIAGYFVSADAVHFWPSGQWAVRVYPSRWQAEIFRPAAAVESVFRGREVSVAVTPGIEA